MTVPQPDSQYEATARTMWSNFTKAALLASVIAAIILLIMAATLV